LHIAYRQLIKTPATKKSSDPVPSEPPEYVYKPPRYVLPSSSKTVQPPLPDGPISPEDATPIHQANDERPVDVVPMDVDTTMNEKDRHVDEQDVREDEDEGIFLSEDEPFFESDEGEPDQLEDKVALEEEELRKDHQGLDESPAVMVPLEAPTVMVLQED
jgi:hypothetical protein